MKRFFIILLLLISFFSCKSEPEVIECGIEDIIARSEIYNSNVHDPVVPVMKAEIIYDFIDMLSTVEIADLKFLKERNPEYPAVIFNGKSINDLNLTEKSKLVTYLEVLKLSSDVEVLDAALLVPEELPSELKKRYDLVKLTLKGGVVFPLKVDGKVTGALIMDYYRYPKYIFSDYVIQKKSDLIITGIVYIYTS